MTTTRRTQPPTRGWPARGCHLVAALLVAAFLASIARFYHPIFGFTTFIAFGADHEYEIPAVQAVPHIHYTGGYDGQFYAQLAVEPLLRDPVIDRSLDSAPYRARRILLSWTAHILGLGRPAWVLQAYALQNVLSWLLLAWLLTRWLPIGTFRGLALWIACLWNLGILGSVRLALVDGPSLLLIACAVAAAERGRTWTSSAIFGVAGLARETNLLGLGGLPLDSLRRPSTGDGGEVTSRLQRGIRFGAKLAILALAAGVAVVPLLLWQDYLWSIYRRGSFTNQNQLTIPITAFAWKWSDTIRGLVADGLASRHAISLAATISLTTQAVYLCVKRSYGLPWWRVAAAYAVLMLLVDKAVWDGSPGAVMRVLLPLTVGFNILLLRHTDRSFWAWYVVGNLQLAFAYTMLRP